MRGGICGVTLSNIRPLASRREQTSPVRYTLHTGPIFRGSANVGGRIKFPKLRTMLSGRPSVSDSWLGETQTLTLMRLL